MQTRKPIVGSIIYSKDAIISKGGTNLGRLFAVNSIDDAGNMKLWALISALPTTEAAVEVTPDKINWLRKPAHLLVNIEVQMSALWDYVQQPGTLDSAIMTAAAQCIERYKKEDKTLITVQAGEPMEIDSRDVRDKINDLYANFKKDPTVYLEYLQFSARFYQYSARNAALIYTQNPHSTFVTSRHRWLQLGYSIKQSDNRRNLEIFKPVTQKYINRNGTLIPLRDATRNEKLLIASKAIPLIEKQYYAKMPVWDISQTNCPPSEYPRIYDMGRASVPHRQLWEAVKQVAELEGIAVITEDLRSISARGYYNLADNTIHLNQIGNDTTAAITLCHEYAHALLHNTSGVGLPVEIQEFEAESLALVLACRYGLPEDDLDAGYMAQYLNKANANPTFSMEKSVQLISKALKHIDERITANLPQNAPEQEFTMEAQIKQNFLQGLERM